jgi:hypothetical protein
MQPLTIFLSRLIGLFAIALSLAIILHRKSFVEMASEMVRDPPLLFLVGLITLAIGLAMVLSHNIWSGGVLPHRHHAFWLDPAGPGAHLSAGASRRICLSV